MRRLLLLGAGLLACAPKHPPAPQTRSHEEVADYVTKRIGAVAPGTRVTRRSPGALALVFPDGTKAAFLLDTAFALCAHPGEGCDRYVDKLVASLREEDEEDGEE